MTVPMGISEEEADATADGDGDGDGFEESASETSEGDGAEVKVPVADAAKLTPWSTLVSVAAVLKTRELAVATPVCATAAVIPAAVGVSRRPSWRL
jgi:hypothetical protein